MGKIKKFLQGLVERLKEAYRGLNPESSIAQLARDTIRSSEEALNAFADAAGDAVVNYRLQDGKKITPRRAIGSALERISKPLQKWKQLLVFLDIMVP